MTIVSQPFASVIIESANAKGVSGETNIVAPSGGGIPPLTGQVVFLANWETDIGFLPFFDDTGLQRLDGTATVGTVNPKFGIGALEGNGTAVTRIENENATLMDIRVSTRSWTLEGWLRFNSGGPSSPGADRDIVSVRQRNGGSYIWQLVQGATGDSPRTLRLAEDMANLAERNLIFDVPELIEPDRWYHTALVNNAGLWTLFLDGVSQATATPNLVWISTFDADHFDLFYAVDVTSTNRFDSNRYLMDQALYTTDFDPVGPLTES